MTPLVQLRTFLEVHRAGSISRAAATLGITQPAASGHIRTLEAQIGRKLFRRHARGVEATAAAKELAASIAPSLDGLDITFGSMRARAEAVAGTLRIAGPSEFLRARLVEPLSQLSAIGLSLRVTLGGRDVIYAAIRRGEVDLAVTASRPSDPEIGFAVIAEEALVPVASPLWVARVLGGKRGLRDALDHPVVAYGEELPLVARAVEAVGGASDRLRPSAVVPDLRMVRDLVEAGIGWSVLPDYLIEDGIASRSLVKLDAGDSPVRNRIYLAWLKAALRHPRVSFARQKLLDALR